MTNDPTTDLLVVITRQRLEAAYAERDEALRNGQPTDRINASIELLSAALERYGARRL